jgi:hypothetical protein
VNNYKHTIGLKANLILQPVCFWQALRTIEIINNPRGDIEEAHSKATFGNRF